MTAKTDNTSSWSRAAAQLQLTILYQLHPSSAQVDTSPSQDLISSQRPKQRRAQMVVPIVKVPPVPLVIVIFVQCICCIWMIPDACYRCCSVLQKSSQARRCPVRWAQGSMIHDGPWSPFSSSPMFSPFADRPPSRTDPSPILWTVG